MTNISITKYIDSRLPDRFFNVLELGSGDVIEALEVSNNIDGEYIAIDKKGIEKEVDSKISFIKEDFFDVDLVEKEIGNKSFDLIIANYSLCFNKRERVIGRLPYHFDKLTDEGVFYVSDFTVDEKVVKKRNNLDEEWFFDLIRKHFKRFDISKEEVYEKAHDHTHNIFELVAYK